ncbi:hypothetical protein MIR68_006492 [Amoeboaphelidium protococcarum]|nr:hypothetical protein MIR68_006492 [Amoeboaphelidium protococcarum]
MDPFVYCRDTLLKKDYEGYLLSLAYPSGHRYQFVLRALNVELVQIRETAKNDLAGLMRFRWYSDQVERVFDTAEASKNIRSDGSIKGSGHPVIDALKIMLYRDKVPVDRNSIMALISARQNDFMQQRYDTLDEFQHHCRATYGNLLQLYGQVSDHTSSPNKVSINQIASVVGMSNLLRSVVPNAQSGRVLVPSHLLEDYSLTADKLVNLIQKGPQQQSSDNERQFVELTKHIAGELEKELGNLKAESSQSSSSTDLAQYLNALPAQLFVQKLKRNQFNLLSIKNPRLQTLPLRLFVSVKLRRWI